MGNPCYSESNQDLDAENGEEREGIKIGSTTDRSFFGGVLDILQT